MGFAGLLHDPLRAALARTHAGGRGRRRARARAFEVLIRCVSRQHSHKVLLGVFAGAAVLPRRAQAGPRASMTA